MKPWGFYGRQQELQDLQAIFQRKRWFFVQISGRRRIGKTSLIQRALELTGRSPGLYFQIPDSDSLGVLRAVNDYLATYGLPQRVQTLAELAHLIGDLVRQGHVVALDEFQYFSRKPLFDFCSLLQAEVDQLAAQASQVQGGLVVLGSLHSEMSALLEDRVAPLFNRTTDKLALDHLDIASLLELLHTHAGTEPERVLFLWNLFEGVPKFYRDAYEREVLQGSRQELLKAMFFNSSSPLQGEANNWFLGELRGRYDSLLHYVAQHPGSTNADIEAALTEPGLNSEPPSSSEQRQLGGFLKVLTQRYGLIVRRLPVFASASARTGRYYIRDNFLRSWLVALQKPVAAMSFRPLEPLILQADQLLAEAEGQSLEMLAGRLYQELSQRGLGDFPLSEQISGYWNRAGVVIDLVAVSQDTRCIRFASCKRNEEKLVGSMTALKACAQVFLQQFPKFQGWQAQYCGIAPSVTPAVRQALERQGVLAQSLTDLWQPLRP